MTVIRETRHTEQGTPYDVYAPLYNTGDAAYRAWFVEQLREYLHRQGANVHACTDDELLRRIRHTFGPSRVGN